jgi:hypothetical protein
MQVIAAKSDATARHPGLSDVTGRQRSVLQLALDSPPPDRRAATIVRVNRSR